MSFTAMTKRKGFATLAAAASVALIITACSHRSRSGITLGGMAEGLWGERIDLDSCRSGLTVITPFSPAT